MSSIRLATWNVNSLKVRLPHLIKWLEDCDQRGAPIDLIGLQELKLTDDKFPQEELEKAGYLSLFMGQKTYNGVAIVIKKSALAPLHQYPETAFVQVQYNLPDFVDEQKRLLATTIHFKETEPIRVMCGYFPNGQAPGTEKFAYKLAWLSSLENFLLQEMQTHPRLVLMGDFNIAPRDNDVHDPAAWMGQNLVSEEERAFFHRFEQMGLVDSFRLFEQAPKTFSWWDYRMMGFRRNAGVRIDHHLISPALKEHCVSCIVDKEPRKWEQPSDHAPVVMTLQKSI
jgi:exodeoxyribonuclease-3